jgi:CheY-like chemotaxis protein
MRQITILAAEDDEDYAFFIGKALENMNITRPLTVLGDGEQVINYLAGEGKYADRGIFPFPDILLTDLKMPRMSGLEVLAWLQENEGSALIPTILLSSSADPADVTRAYELGANAYLVKPPDFNLLEKMLQSTCQFWLPCESDFSRTRHSLPGGVGLQLLVDRTGVMVGR